MKLFIDIVTGGWRPTVTDADFVTGGWCPTVTDTDCVTGIDMYP
jgi:hypothetical protein